MAITVQEAQVIFSADGLAQVKNQAGAAGVALDRTTSRAGRLQNALSSVRRSMSGIGGLLGTLGAGAAAGWMMKLAGGAEQTAISFEVMLGSAGKAKTMIDEMRQLDLKSAFSFQDLSEAGKLMLNFGVVASDVLPTLNILGDIAAGDTEKLHRLSLAFGQMTAQGRLMGQDLLQMVNAGFNPLQEISRKTGESMTQLKKRMEDGGISSQEVALAFQSATQAGGRFFGMNDRMSKTTIGQWNKLKGSISLVAIEIGTQLLPVANKLIQWAADMVTKTDGVGTAFGKLVKDTLTWFQSISDSVSDMGVVCGTIFGEISVRFAGMWENMKTLAQAFFDWFSQNASVMGDNIAIHFSNAQKMLAAGTMNPREQKEFTNYITGEKEMKDVSALQPDKQFVPFKPPTMPFKAGRTMTEAIAEELETARKIRQEGRVEAGGKNVDKTMGLKAGERGPRIPQQPTPGEGGRSQTFSAESLFSYLRQGAQDKQLGLLTQGVGLQQQQVAGIAKVEKAVKGINLGLA